MSFIDLPLGDTKIPEPLPEGMYDLRIVTAEPNPKPEKGRTDIQIRMEVIDQPDAESVFEHLIGIAPGDDADTRNFKLRKILGFLEAFHIPYEGNGFNLEDLPGAEGHVKVKQEEYEGSIRNKINYRW